MQASRNGRKRDLRASKNSIRISSPPMEVTAAGQPGPRDLSEIVGLVQLRLEQVVSQQEALTDSAQLLRPVLLGGKLLRPSLCVLVCDALGGSRDHSIEAAVAVELLHCAALLHDDVVDHHAHRRGRPSVCHEKGHESALLLGDYALGLAFTHAPGATKDFLARCLVHLSQASLDEREFNRSRDSLQQIEVMAGKTGSLFELACTMGAVCAGQSPDRIAGFGRSLGIAYQIADDLVDIQQSLTRGAFRGDLRARHLSYPMLCVPPLHDLLQAYVEKSELDEEAFLQLLRQFRCTDFALEKIAIFQEMSLECLQDLRVHLSLSRFPYVAVSALLQESNGQVDSLH